MDPDTTLKKAIEMVPSGLFLLTSAFEGTRSGVLCRWVQQCSSNPHMVTMAMPKGLPVEPLIRDSRHFALCQISADDVFLQRKFATVPERGDDPFVTLGGGTAPSGSPIVSRAMNYLDCELMSHFEFDSQFRLYVGLVHHAEILNLAKPLVYFGENGYSAPSKT